MMGRARVNPPRVRTRYRRTRCREYHGRPMQLSTTRRPWRLLVTLALLVAAPCAAAPDADVVAAARAFEEGQRAQLRGDYATAAELFELADRTVPSAAALRSAIRNFEAAGNAAHAVTLAQRATDRYPGDADTRRLVEGVLARLTPGLAHVVARCLPQCTLAVDGRAATPTALSRHELYLAPGDHQLEGRAGDGRRDGRVVRVAAGDSEQLTLHPTTLPATADATLAATAPRRDRRLPP